MRSHPKFSKEFAGSESRSSLKLIAAWLPEPEAVELYWAWLLLLFCGFLGWCGIVVDHGFLRGFCRSIGLRRLQRSPQTDHFSIFGPSQTFHAVGKDTA